MARDASHYVDLYGTQAVNYAAINETGADDNELVAAVAGRKIRVYEVFLGSAGDSTVRFESGAGGAALTGIIDVAAANPFVAPFSPVGHFETVAGQSLSLENGGAVDVDGWLVYGLVP